MELTANRGNKNFFRYWLISGTPVHIVPNFLANGGGDWGVFILNEGGPNIKLSNVSGSVLSQWGLLLISGSNHYDYWSADGWWAEQFNTSSGSVCGYWVSG